jgi:prephenate dehydrogenase
MSGPSDTGDGAGTGDDAGCPSRSAAAHNVRSFERSPARGSGPERRPAAHEAGAVAIVGAGQVGTMLGMALTAHRSAAGVTSVTLFDRDARVARTSLARGAGDAVGADVADAFGARTILLAVPVDQIVSLLDEFGARVPEGSLVIDAGSAKVAVVTAMRRSIPSGAHAVGGHPMAGTERPGPHGAEPGRLRGATFVLTPAREDHRALERARSFVRAVGARPLTMDAAEHDRAVALTSHLPHLLAYALAAAIPKAAGTDGAAEPALADLVASGFLGASRLAESDPATTAAFLHANAAAIAEASKGFAASFDALLALLGDQGGLRTALESARERRRALLGGAGT